MNIHEYQAKAVLREFGVPVPRGVPAFNVDEAVKGAQELGGPVWVVKAQIHAGGRGKAGGVKVVKSIDDVKKESTRILGSTLVTHQTGPHGKKVNRLYIEEGSAIDREFYLSALIDRETSRVAFVVSTEGGMDIEEVAHKTPEKILTFSVDPATGIMPHHGRRVAQTLKLTGDLAKQIETILPKLYTAFTTKDMSLLEINPLVVTKDNKIICLDAKVGFDGNALYRHPDIVALRDLTEEDEKEVEASKFDLNYIALDGSIGCMVNGAGLAMATHGHHQALWHDAGQLSRRRRQRHQGESHGGIQDHHLRSEREGHSRQHFRWHHEMRRDRRGCCRRGEGSRPEGAAGGSSRRHQRRARQKDHQGIQALTSRRVTISTTPRRKLSKP